MKENKKILKISEKISLKLEELEKEYDLKLSKFKEKLDSEYKTKKKYLLGENELENFINSIGENTIIPATYNFFESNLKGEYGISNKKFSTIWLPNDSCVSEKELKSKKYDQIIDIALKFLYFYDEYNFNNIVLSKDNKVFNINISKEGTYNGSRSLLLCITEVEPLLLYKNRKYV